LRAGGSEMPKYVYDMYNVGRNGAPGAGFESEIEAPNEREALRQLKVAAELRQQVSQEKPSYVRTRLYSSEGGEYVRDTNKKW
jgi:hypothetical protein